VRGERARAQAAFLPATVQQRHQAEARFAAHAQRADALGPCTLWAVSASRSMQSRFTSSGSLPAPCAASTWNSTRARGRAGHGAHVLHDADLVVHVHERDEQRVAAQRGLDLRRLDDAVATGLRYVTSKPSRSSCRHASSTAGCSVRDVTRWRPRSR